MTDNAFDNAYDNAFERASEKASDPSSTRDSPFLSVPRRPALGAALSPTFVRGLRSVLTAIIALSLGVALVWWLKAGTDDPQPALEKGAPAAFGPAAAVPGRSSWARRSEPAQPARSGSHR